MSLCPWALVRDPEVKKLLDGLLHSRRDDPDRRGVFLLKEGTGFNSISRNNLYQ
jgi:hypothetical protein